MKLKKVKGTLRHSFDVAHITELLEEDRLDEDDAKRILGEALHVVGGLRSDIRTLHLAIDSLKDTKDWTKDSLWLRSR